MSRLLGPHHQPPALPLVEMEVLNGGGLGCVPVETSCCKGRRSSADLLLMPTVWLTLFSLVLMRPAPP